MYTLNIVKKPYKNYWLTIEVLQLTNILLTKSSSQGTKEPFN